VVWSIRGRSKFETGAVAGLCVCTANFVSSPQTFAGPAVRLRAALERILDSVSGREIAGALRWWELQSRGEMQKATRRSEALCYVVQRIVQVDFPAVYWGNRHCSTLLQGRQYEAHCMSQLASVP
jgi:hypothetical protein